MAVTGRFDAFPVRTPGRFGQIPLRSGRFGRGRRLSKYGTFTELRKIPISTEMSVVLLRKHGTYDIS